LYHFDSIIRIAHYLNSVLFDNFAGFFGHVPQQNFYFLFKIPIILFIKFCRFDVPLMISKYFPRSIPTVNSDSSNVHCGESFSHTNSEKCHFETNIGSKLGTFKILCEKLIILANFWVIGGLMAYHDPKIYT